MASLDTTENDIISTSPREDFNPLDDYVEAKFFDAVDTIDLEDGIDEESPVNSLDLEMSDVYRYGITPPHNPREARRIKLKFRDHRAQHKMSKTDVKDQAAQSQKVDKARSSRRYGIMLDRMGNDHLNCGVDPDQVSSDSVFEVPNRDGSRKHKDSSKPFKMTRGFDRDYKHNASEMSSLESSAGASQLSQKPLNVDLPRKLKSLNSKPVFLDIPPVDQDSLTSCRRSSNNLASECPKDRIDFCNTFQLLVNMGSTAKRERESKILPYSRQLSSEQEVYESKLHDLLWLQLQAYFQGNTMEIQDSHLCRERENVPQVLNEIMTFKVDVPADVEESTSVLLSPADQTGGNPFFDQLNASINNSFQIPTLTQSLRSVILQHQSAIKQVSAVLDKLERIEKLYPTLKTLSKEHPQYCNEAFIQRANTLNMWLNLSRELGHKLQIMSRELYLDQIDGLVIPWEDYENPSELLYNLRNPTNIFTPQSESDESESETDSEDEDQSLVSSPIVGREDEHKNVRFRVKDHKTGEVSSQPTSPISALPNKGSASRALSVSLSRISSSVSVEEFTRTSIYRYFVDRTLKKYGLRKLLVRLTKILDSTLQKTKQSLECPTTPTCAWDQTEFTINRSHSNSTENTRLSSSPSLDGATYSLYLPERRISLCAHGVWCDDFTNMQLPSFKPLYLFLVRMPLDIVHECLRLRLEQMQLKPSAISVAQLMRECKELLPNAVTVKQYYQQMVAAVVPDEDHEKFTMDIEQFDEDMQKTMEVYFGHLQFFVRELQHGPEMSKHLKEILETEWNFTKQVSPHIHGGEASACKRFCLMASNILSTISDLLESGIDDHMGYLYESTLGDDSDEEFEEVDRGKKRMSRSGELRSAISQACRSIKDLFHDAKECSSNALGFAKKLRKDMEIATDFSINVTAADLLDKLKETDHVRVITPMSAGSLMFVPHRIDHDQQQILHLLNVTCGREDFPHPDTIDIEEGYLLLVKCEGAIDKLIECPLWQGPTLKVAPNAETTIALSHIEVESLFLVVIHSSQLSAQRRIFQQLMGSAVQLINEQTSCHQAIAESLTELKNAAMDLRSHVADAICQVKEKLHLDDVDEMDELEKTLIQKNCTETLHRCYGFGFDYHRELTRLVSGDQRTQLSKLLVSFANQWMTFVSDKCERGKGVRPRWSYPGMEFLTLTCDPRVLAILSEEEFEALKRSINSCISHLVGAKPSHSSGTLTPGYRMNSPDPSQMKRINYIPDPLLNSRTPRKIQSEPPTPLHSISSESVELNTQRRPSVEINDGDTGGILLTVNTPGKDSTKAHVHENAEEHIKQKILQKLESLEQERTTKLHSNGCIGRVVSHTVERDYHINVRKVNFKWQRGIKIGEGQFGKVYTAVNMESGVLMAMKEIRLQPNDHQTLKEIADELKIFEGIQHVGLVKYYGVEVHREEMLIFMEYCEEGTLEEAAKQGLSEIMIRKYTQELISAVNLLHESGIVHRDIKGANIFLTAVGLKLGDFGSSVKLKNHTTMPGEINTLVGTAAFMAPEVITRDNREGSGRTSDIWSVGCVVIQMASGKRPWHELETNVMIMFKVGMGGTPAIPECVTKEGQSFLSHCLSHDPRSRWSASQLLDHPFVKVYCVDDASRLTS